MNDKNDITLQGRLTRDAEVKYTNTGTALANIAIASNYSYKKGDDWTDEVSYFDVVAWGKLAEAQAELKKGTPVIVFGRLKQERWQVQDGATRSRVNVVADKIVVTVSARKEAPDGA